MASMNNFAFQLMALEFKIRDFLHPRAEFLREVDIKPGNRVLDYGCGPGGYTLAAAERVGPDGKVYALDILPIAIKTVQDAAFTHGLTNIETIQSGCATHLPDASVDFAFLFDIFHMLEDPDQVLSELRRILKRDGILCVNDHHLQKEDIIRRFSLSGAWALKQNGENILQFTKM